MKRLTIHMHKGTPHVLDFDADDEAAAALSEVNTALSTTNTQALARPVTIAGRLVVRPGEIRSAELGDPPMLIA